MTLRADGTLLLDPFEYDWSPLDEWDIANGVDEYPTEFSYHIGDSDTPGVVTLVYNEAPIAKADSVTLRAGGAITLDVLANDEDDENDELTVVAIQETDTTFTPSGGLIGFPVAVGDAVIENNLMEITPHPEYSGTFTFYYRIVDGNEGTASTGGAHGVGTGGPTLETSHQSVGQVTVTVLANNAPAAGDDTANVGEDGTVTVSVLGNDTDADGDALTIGSYDTTGTLGTVTDNGDGTFDYDPGDAFQSLARGELATDTFTYTVNDGQGGEDTATVTISIDGANDSPIGTSDTFTTDAGTAFTTGDVLANDVDVDTAAMLTASGPLEIPDHDTKGEVTNNGDGTFDYDPNGAFDHLAAGETATDQFWYGAKDENGATSATKVFITITGWDDPLLTDDTAAATEDVPIVISSVFANDTGQGLSIAAVDLTATQGTVTNNGDGTFGYVADGTLDALSDGETTEDSFTYTAIDDYGREQTATVTVTVTGANDDVVPIGQTIVINADSGTRTWNYSFSDPDTNDTHGFVLDTEGTEGTATDNGNGKFTYTPGDGWASVALGQAGYDSFDYTVTDSAGSSASGTVNFVIVGVNDDPVGVDDHFGTDEQTPFTTGNVLANDTDVDEGATLSLAGFDTSATIGLVTDNGDGTFAYDPNGAFDDLAIGERATDTFTYTVEDEHGASDTATVTITIDGTPYSGIVGTDLSETLNGTEGDDTLWGVSADDTLNGDDGHDTAAYDGNLADFKVEIAADHSGVWVSDGNTADPRHEGTDWLTGIEEILFANGWATVKSSEARTLITIFDDTGEFIAKERLSGGIRTEVAYVDGVRNEVLRTDIDDVRVWDTVETSYEDGDLARRFKINDAGSSVLVQYEDGVRTDMTRVDASGADSTAAWSTIECGFDDAGRLSSRRVVNDDGTERTTTFEYTDGVLSKMTIVDGPGDAGAVPWAIRELTFDDSGRRIERKQVDDDGTESGRAYEYTDGVVTKVTATGSDDGFLFERSSEFDADGDLVGRSWVFDDGTVRDDTIVDDALVSRTMTDVPDTRHWTTATFDYDADHNVITRSYTWDADLA
ncbi:Ig-like domain-containing protein [Acuticoccus sp. MNP-M23]|uniref:Ig-like domain-containing protein n=1 Tax=Acuticoccus sp. MNP-M23 TaxID=3072793 RepID=UPI00281548B4|nr:Ig-like domain-containing protein [Acuticoccus sp. MNP-M23]WMS41846.1 Ig-like domain-containing protein [Acuticoccus sp. MNP-M23]